MFTMVAAGGAWTGLGVLPAHAAGDRCAAVAFLAKSANGPGREGSANGRYGLLAQGSAMAASAGCVTSSRTPLWSLAGWFGSESAARLGLSGYEPAATLYDELDRRSLRPRAGDAAARGGSTICPMLMKEDPGWTTADERKRPRPQTGQWALSHAIYPGLVFDKTIQSCGVHRADASVHQGGRADRDRLAAP